MVEHLFSMAFSPVQSCEDVIVAQFQELLTSEGFEVAPSSQTASDPALRFYLRPKIGNSVWICLEDQSQSELLWARLFSQKFQVPVEVHEVHGQDILKRSPSGEDCFEIVSQSFRIAPDKDIQFLSSVLDDEPEIAHTTYGDFYETVDTILQIIINNTLDKTREAHRIDLYRSSRSQELSPRLEKIVKEAKNATSLALEDIGGSSFLRITNIDGSKHLAKVNTEELHVIENVLGEHIAS